jgi:hypothetical protein
MTKKAQKSVSDADVGKLRKTYNLLGSANANERDAAFTVIFTILKRYNRTWSDLLGLISAPSTMAMNVASIDRKTLREQHELLGGTVKERETARTAILWILERYRASWNDLLGVISDVGNFSSSPTVLILLPVPEAPDPLDILVSFLPQFIDVTDDEVVAIALWILHLFFFEQFETTPRLVLASPVPGCGKTVVLECIELLGKRPLKTDGITPASIYHLIDSQLRSVQFCLTKLIIMPG